MFGNVLLKQDIAQLSGMPWHRTGPGRKLQRVYAGAIEKLTHPSPELIMRALTRSFLGAKIESSR